MAGKLVLCRHGQSEWNLKNLFTGWHDVDLTEKGVQEAAEAGRLLKGLDYDIDIAFTSVLPQQGGDRQKIWRRQGAYLAAQLRHATTGAGNR